jgi:hypothetical protein
MEKLGQIGVGDVASWWEPNAQADADFTSARNWDSSRTPARTRDLLLLPFG